MTTEFLLYADLVLGLRLGWLLSDRPVGPRGWGSQGLVTVLALGLFTPCWFLAGAAATVLAVNAAGLALDRRSGDRGGGRLLLGVVQLAALSVCFAPMGGVRFRPELAALGPALTAATTLGPAILALLQPKMLKVILGLLLAANEANLVIRWVLGRLQLKPGPASPAGLDAGEYNRGRVIGLLERTLIYFFVLSGQFGAIGFTLAAKGFTRFKELEHRGFAEYVLIGTLLSSSLAMAAGAWVRFAP